MKRVIAVLIVVLMGTQPASAQDVTPIMGEPPVLYSHKVFLSTVAR